MKVQAMTLEGDKPQVTVILSPEEAMALAKDLAGALEHEHEDRTKVGHATWDAICMRLGHMHNALLDACESVGMKWTPTPEIQSMIDEAVIASSTRTKVAEPAWRVEHRNAGGGDVVPVPDPFTGTFKGIPLQHVEWALKVYKASGTATLRNSPVLERVFPKGEAEAKEFFTRTQNVWNMRVSAGEAKAYEVVLGVQDARKHKKKGSFREVDNALCTGNIK